MSNCGGALVNKLRAATACPVACEEHSFTASTAAACTIKAHAHCGARCVNDGAGAVAASIKPRFGRTADAADVNYGAFAHLHAVLQMQRDKVVQVLQPQSAHAQRMSWTAPAAGRQTTPTTTKKSEITISSRQYTNPTKPCNLS